MSKSGVGSSPPKYFELQSSKIIGILPKSATINCKDLFLVNNCTAKIQIPPQTAKDLRENVSDTFNLARGE